VVHYCQARKWLVLVESFTRYATEIAWKTDVCVAEAASHLIHFNGSRFLGPNKYLQSSFTEKP